MFDEIETRLFKGLDPTVDGRFDRDGSIVVQLRGVPIGKPRQTQRDKWKKRPAVVRYRAFSDILRAVAGPMPAPEDVVDLSWLALFDPTSAAKRQSTALTRRRGAMLGTIHRQKPDRDNIDKAILDALFKRDAAIGRGLLVKRWGYPSRLIVVVSVR